MFHLNTQENQVGLKLNGTHQLLAYADDVNLLGDNIDTIKKNTEIVIGASKEVGLEINVDKTKYMLLSLHQNIGQNREIKIANRSFENVPQFKYLGTIVPNKILIQELIKRTLNSGNACYHSVQNFLSSRLLSKNLKIRIYKTIILPVVLSGCETWFLTNLVSYEAVNRNKVSTVNSHFLFSLATCFGPYRPSSGEIYN
jgi:hypothetical protein